MEIIDEARLCRAPDAVVALTEGVLKAEGVQGAVTIAFVDERTIRDLNQRFRGLNEPTDVLSFGESAEKTGNVDWPELPWTMEASNSRAEAASDLGEIVVCPQAVYRYAEEDGNEAGRQLAWTIVHGILHLLGYEHETDGEEMRRREQSLLTALGDAVRALSC